ncbi:right-handed parallel beta-helix repeat-containing protein, partial [Methanobrevibacter sp.]|uniref:right-handed parallel beta-helix repeat-containing protein n=1 Tax=Methanobrevibacter sp. TaxID=66852 RepID=UPI00388F12ED
MKFKKSMFILILAVFLISIAGVCASDVNDTAVASQENAVMESTVENAITIEDSEPAVITAENDDILSDSADDEIVGVENDLDELSASNLGTYSELSIRMCNGSEVQDYDNSLLKDVNLTLTSTNGRVNTPVTGLGKDVQYNAEGAGIGTITASIENAASTATLKISDGKTFLNLNDLINSNNNDTITLDNDYTYDPTFDSDLNEGIIINRSLTIIGNGHVLNASNLARIFYILSDDVTFENITFANGKAERSGGAIYWGANNGNVLGCNFVNNYASYGAAIWWYGANGNVSGCSFVNNSASYNGGAIYWERSANSVVSDCSFVSNSAYDGGAIYWENSADAVVSDCSFVSNSADGAGGAIYWDSSDRGVVSDCSFVDNSARRYGGALYWDGNDGVVSGCIFVNNRAEDKSVIKFYNEDKHNLSVNDNIFLNDDGVAISFVRSDSTSNTDYNWFGHNSTNYMDNPNIENCNIWLFLNATQNPDIIFPSETCNITFKLYSFDSGIVSEYDKEVTLTLTPTDGKVGANCTDLGKPVQFTAESVEAKLTAAIANVVETIQLRVRDGATFEDLNRTINGNGNDTITLDRDYRFNPLSDYDFIDGIVINRAVTIIGNNHNISGAGQARIFNVIADGVVIKNTTFINAKTTYGGAVTWDGENGLVSGCSFVNNFAGENGGAVIWGGENGLVSGCSFVNNSAGYNGGAISWFAYYGTLSGCSFVNNHADNEGGAVEWAGNHGNIFDCSFVNNSAMFGGAISMNSHSTDSQDSNVSACSFVNNSADDDGGAIYWVESSGNVFDCSFVNNRADNEGGAVAWIRSNGGGVSDCSFVNNSARDGGAIDWHLNYGGVVSGCSFVNNSADYASAIIWDRSDRGAISGCIFINNTDDRAVIYYDNMGGGKYLVSINDNIFLNNAALAIEFVLQDSDSNVDYNWFGHNATNYYTEPVTTNTGITTWLFLNATANPDSIELSEVSDILFKLYSYNTTGVSDYDNSGLYPVNLTVTATNGDVDERIIALGDSVEYTYNGGGDASVTAAIENAEYTVVLDAAKANSILSADDLVMAYRDGSAWAVTLTDADANPIANAVVKVGILGKVYNRKTDADGVASLPINLISGTYAINATFDGDGDYESSFADATVTVNRAVAVLTGYDLEMTYKDGSSWIVALSDADGNAIAGVRVAIGISGKVYNIKTDDDGNAVLPINLHS